MTTTATTAPPAPPESELATNGAQIRARFVATSLGFGRRSARKVGMVLALLVGLAGMWELYKVVFTALDWEWPVRPDDISMPHVWSIVDALFEPARRGGGDTLVVILSRAAWTTFRSAFAGFVGGTALGLLLALVFLKSGLLRRGFMPYVVASQTVPLIAIAPMVVLWTRGEQQWPAWVAVAIISAYLTFFPVTVNVLRGLTSPSATSLELMRSYAATDTQVLLRVRIPAALPYLFTALRVGATASVVGAIVGELPAGLSDGLGRALLNGAQFYITRPEQLYAAVVVSGTLGMLFAGAVGIVERVVVPKRLEEEL